MQSPRKTLIVMFWGLLKGPKNISVAKWMRISDFAIHFLNFGYPFVYWNLSFFFEIKMAIRTLSKRVQFDCKDVSVESLQFEKDITSNSLAAEGFTDVFILCYCYTLFFFTIRVLLKFHNCFLQIGGLVRQRKPCVGWRRRLASSTDSWLEHRRVFCRLSMTPKPLPCERRCELLGPIFSLEDGQMLPWTCVCF